MKYIRQFQATMTSHGGLIAAVCETCTGETIRCFTCRYEAGEVISMGVLYSDKTGEKIMDDQHCRILGDVEPSSYRRLRAGLKAEAAKHGIEVKFARGLWLRVLED